MRKFYSRHVDEHHHASYAWAYSDSIVYIQ